MNYEVFVHADLLQGVVPRSGLQRRLIFEFLESLKRQPDQPGDFVEKDATLRELQIKIVGKYAITYWVDSPVRKLLVFDIYFAAFSPEHKWCCTPQM